MYILNPVFRPLTIEDVKTIWTVSWICFSYHYQFEKCHLLFRFGYQHINRDKVIRRWECLRWPRLFLWLKWDFFHCLQIIAQKSHLSRRTFGARSLSGAAETPTSCSISSSSSSSSSSAPGLRRSFSVSLVNHSPRTLSIKTLGGSWTSCGCDWTVWSLVSQILRVFNCFSTTVSWRPM